MPIDFELAASAACPPTLGETVKAVAGLAAWTVVYGAVCGVGVSLVLYARVARWVWRVGLERVDGFQDSSDGGGW